jgi:hypothetical protein
VAIIADFTKRNPLFLRGGAPARALRCHRLVIKTKLGIKAGAVFDPHVSQMQNRPTQ